MCGIAGIFNYSDSQPVNFNYLNKMSKHMFTRGPDAEGIWRDDTNGIAFVHRRLAIQDTSSAANQPLMSAYTGNQIVFNGEIYNFHKLRKELECDGFKFLTNSDTEVLLYLYENKGTEMLKYLRGMYAFAIWDTKNHSLFCARDPFGIKPFYFVNDGKTFAFASQVKTLLQLPSVSVEPDSVGLAGYFIMGSIPEPYTSFRQIKPLEPDSYIVIDSFKCNYKKGKTILSVFLNEANKTVTAESVFDSFTDSVKYHMVSDVEVGTFLSSGLDSTMISSVASMYSPGKIRAITAGFKEFQGTDRDETVFASQIADIYKLKHEISWIEKNDFNRSINKIFTMMDQPSIDGINTYLISEIAAKSGLKVILSGIGGDELFGGYSEFTSIPRLVAIGKLIPKGKEIGRLLRKTADLIVKNRYSKYKSILEYGTNYCDSFLLRKSVVLPWNLDKEIFNEIITINSIEEVINSIQEISADLSLIQNNKLKVSYLEIAQYLRNQLLRDADWASMAHSLEIRVPFLDIPLLKSAVAYLSSNKNTCKKDIARLLNPLLPDSILNKKKTGFSIPINKWISTEINDSRSYNLRNWGKIVYHKCYSDLNKE